MTNPFVFIILPIFNWEKYILQQLMSIYYQDYKNWHIIIINDWSTDLSLDIIKNFTNNYNLNWKITIKTQTNCWLNKSIENWLLLLKEIITKRQLIPKDIYVAYCDADDIWMPNKLSEQIKFMKENKKCMLCYHDLIEIDENNNIKSFSRLKKKQTIMCDINNQELEEFLTTNYITATSMVFKYELVNRLIPLPKHLYQDWRTVIITKLNWFKIEKVNTTLWFYRRHADAMTAAWKKDNLWFFRILEALYSIKNKNKTIKLFINYLEDRINWEKKNYNLIHIWCLIFIKYNSIFYLHIQKFINYFFKPLKISKIYK